VKKLRTDDRKKNELCNEWPYVMLRYDTLC
jgi:hypothetical protein